MRVRLRANHANAAAGAAKRSLQVDRTGDGSIRGVSLARLGPALGHGFELDATSLAQIAALAGGAKARWTHGEMCADGIGTHLGRFSAPRLSPDGLGVDADFTFSPNAPHVQPEGLAVDARTFLLDAAEREPDTLGLSVVLDGLTLEDLVDAEGKPMLDAQGDPRRAARVTGIPRADFTGDPASNPAGLFAGVGAASLSEGASTVLAAALEAHGASKVRGFLRAWLSANPEPGANALALAPGTSLPPAGAPPVAPSAPPPGPACDGCAAYHAAGHGRGSADAMSSGAAASLEALNARLAVADALAVELRAKLAGADAAALAARVAESERVAADDAAWLESLSAESATLQAPIASAALDPVRAQLAAGNRSAARAIGGALLDVARARSGKPLASATKPLAPPKVDDHQLSVVRGHVQALRAQGVEVTVSEDGASFTVGAPRAAGSPANPTTRKG